MSVFGFLGKILEPVTGIIDKAVTDKDLKQRLKAEVTKVILDNEAEIVKAQASIVIAEAKGQSWMQRNWRPLLMLTIVAIIANNYIIVPYLGSNWPEHIKVLDLPAGLYTLMSIGVGGYVTGRSGEKIVDKWKNKK